MNNKIIVLSASPNGRIVYDAKDILSSDNAKKHLNYVRKNTKMSDLKNRYRLYYLRTYVDSVLVFDTKTPVLDQEEPTIEDFEFALNEEVMENGLFKPSVKKEIEVTEVKSKEDIPDEWLCSLPWQSDANYGIDIEHCSWTCEEFIEGKKKTRKNKKKNITLKWKK